MKKSFLFISCDEAFNICDKAQYGEATFLEKIKLSLRLSWCQVSRNYSKRNTKLSEAIKTSQVDCLKENEKEKIKKTLDQEIAKLK